MIQLADEILSGIGLIRESVPGEAKALEPESKEPMVLAIDIAVQCEVCIAFRTRAGYKHGARRDDFASTT